MYLYDPIDQRIVDERVKQFRDQTRRFLAGKLSEDDFRALRLRNGLYIQRSGNCIRNITTDHFAGVASDEIVDSFVWCEIIRQWSTFNPEFSYLPRKFKIAVNGSIGDRAAVAVHDIGLHALKNPEGEIGFKVLVGGGLGRTPMIGHVMREFL